MSNKTLIKAAVLTFGMSILGACATVETTESVSNDVAAVPATKAAEVPATKTTEAAASKDDRICKRVAVVGSNFKKKVCGTAEAWKKREEEGRRTAGDLQRNGGSPGTGN